MSYYRYLAGLGLVSLLFGCATPPSGISGVDPKKQSLDSYLSSLGEPKADKSRVILYRNTRDLGIYSDIEVQVDKGKNISIFQDRFTSVEVSPGPRDFKTSMPGEWAACEKTLFIPPNSTSYVSIRKRPGEQGKAMAYGMFGIFGAIAYASSKNDEEKKTRCGGMTEVFLVDEDEAKREIQALGTSQN